MQRGEGTLTPPGAIDVPNAVRGASTGFSILVIGGLLAPLTTLISGPVATIWLTAVAVVAFVVAARRSRRAANPGVHGAVAAVFAYLLVLPLLLPFEQGRNPSQIMLTLVTAVLVGALTGRLAARHGRATGPG